MRVLIVGCGYVGLPLGTELARLGHVVYGLRRTAAGAEELRAAGLQALNGDATRAADLAALPGPFDWVVNTISAASRSEADYRRAYVGSAQALLEALAAQPPRKLVYTSSTGVYGQDDGSLVTETSPTEPASPTGRVLVEAERLWLEAARSTGFPAVVLRVAGIYGPGRGYWFKQFVRGEARLEGRGERILNMIHRDDVAGCLLAALERGRAGEVYNTVDDEPVTQLQFFQWLAGAVGGDVPPPASAAGQALIQPRVGNKRVSNCKLKADLHYRFRFPTFREGYAPEIALLKGSGR